MCDSGTMKCEKKGVWLCLILNTLVMSLRSRDGISSENREKGEIVLGN